ARVSLRRDALDLLERARRVVGELARPGQGGVEQLVVGDDLVCKADPLRLPGVDRIAGQIELERLCLADEPRQALRAAEAGDDPEVDLRLAERRRHGCDAEVAR